MGCSRCGNKNWTGPFPICDQCEMCPDCKGMGQTIDGKNVQRVCKGCGGKAWRKKPDAKKSEEGVIRTW